MQSQTTFGAQRNDRIVLVRLLCIFGMIYVHVPAIESTASVSANSLTLFDLIRGLLADGYGRTSASLLSAVAGYLVAKSLTNTDSALASFYFRKFKSVYMPMVVWGLVTVTAFAIASIYKPNVLSAVCGAQGLVLLDCFNMVFHVQSIGAGPTMPLSFLRDLFVCMLLAPLLIPLLRAKPILVLFILLVMYLSGYSSIIILRPLVVLGFSVGLAICIYKINWQWVDRFWMLWVWVAVFMTLHVIAFNAGQLPQLDITFARYGYDAGESLLYPMTRFFGALAIWSLSLHLSKTFLMNWSRRLEPVLFVAFCAHPLLFSILQSVAGLFVENATLAMVYPIWFVFAPIAVLLLVKVGMQYCAMLLPSVVEWMTGGRVAVRVSDRTITNSSQMALVRT